MTVAVRHYLWAGLDFMLDARGCPVLLEANRCSHMLGEYLRFHEDERPFERIASAMNACDGPPAVLWRAGDPFPDADEDVCFITRHLTQFLRIPPVVCDVEANRVATADGTLLSRDGIRLRPGSLFRWWYDLPWEYERQGMLVINPNCAWVAVRDKAACARTVADAETFRVPWGVCVDSAEEARALLESHGDRFADGYVVKPRVGWGGYGVQVADRGEAVREFSVPSLLSERVRPPSGDGLFWDARLFVMNGVCVGGLCHSSRQPNTNFFQGGTSGPLEPELFRRFAPAAEEAVARLDAAADRIHQIEPAPRSDLTRVVY